MSSTSLVGRLRKAHASFDIADIIVAARREALKDGLDCSETPVIVVVNRRRQPEERWVAGPALYDVELPKYRLVGKQSPAEQLFRANRHTL